jgi:hypothetical protein
VIVVERLRHGDGKNERGGHRGEHRGSPEPLLRLDDVAEPRVADPRPPQQCEDQQPAHDHVGGQVARHQGRDLCEGEDEDEVEEQLDRRDASLLLDRQEPRVPLGVHRVRLPPAGGEAPGRPPPCRLTPPA